MTFYLILSFSVFFISLIGTKLVILTIQNRPVSPNIELITGKRKLPPAANGGIALVFSCIIGLLGTEIDYRVILSIFLLMGFSLLNNITKLPVSLKLIIRLIAVIIPVSIFDFPIFSGFATPFFDKILAISLWLWIIHSFEKLEKVEGMLPIQIISIGLGLSAITILSEKFFSPLSIQSLIFSTAGAGFLWWNFYPAKVLAGDIASVPCGFIAGYLLLFAASSGYPEAAIILPAYFLADSAITFFNRPFSEKLEKNKKPKPRPLFCFRAIINSRSPEWITRTIAGINMLLVLLEAQILISPQMSLFNVAMAYAMVFTSIWFFARMINRSL